jgi:hypothetical protein
MNAIHEIDDPSVQPEPGHPGPFTSAESESFDIRDLEPRKPKSELSRRDLWVRLFIYGAVILLVLFWFSLRVAGTLG